MLLPKTTQSLVFKLAEAKVTNEVSAYAAFFDSATVPTADITATTSNGTTEVELVAAPSATGVRRQIFQIEMVNRDTVSHTVSIYFKDGSTETEIQRATLAPGYSMGFEKSLGWTVRTPTGLFIAGQIPGTATNDDAAPGMIGELIESEVDRATGSPAITSATAKDVTTITVPAGDWDLQGMVGSNPTAGQTTTQQIGYIGLTANTSPTNFPSKGLASLAQSLSIAAGSVESRMFGRKSFAASTTLHLIIATFFTGGTGCTAYGYIRARRAR